MKIWLSNFHLTLYTDKDLHENSLLWKFEIFWLLLFWTMSVGKSASIYESWGEKQHVFTIVISQDRTNPKIWNFHNKLFSWISVFVGSFKSKFEGQFSRWMWGAHGRCTKNTVKIRYLGRNKLGVRTLFRLFLAHEGVGMQWWRSFTGNRYEPVIVSSVTGSNRYISRVPVDIGEYWRMPVNISEYRLPMKQLPV